MRSPARLVIPLLLLALAAAELFLLHNLQGLEHALQDSLLRRHAERRVPDADIVLVKIDERSLEAMSAEFGRFPWPRSVYAQFIELLAPQQPAAIVLDINFAEPDHLRPADDRYFVEVVRATPQVYVPLVRLESADDSQGLALAQYGDRLGFTRTSAARPDARVALLLPFQGIVDTGRIGAINFLADANGVGRRYYLRIDKDGWHIPSLPARVARDLGYAVPDQADIELNWRGHPRQRAQVSFSDLFMDLGRAEPQRPRDEFRGKVVIVGAAAVGLSDLRATPISGLHPGMDILATAIDNLKHGDALRRPPAAVDWGLTALLVLLVSIGFRLGWGPTRTGLAMLLLTPAILGLAYALLAYRWLLPVATPLLFMWLCHGLLSLSDYLRLRAERLHAIQVFGRFVDPRVVDQLVQRGSSLLDAPGQSRRITLLFSDIRGFTTLSETRPPEEIVQLLNRYFSRQVEVVFRHGGTVDKFIGDAIMAFWGAPVDDEHQARNAVAAALEMAAVVDDFRAELGELGRDFDIGIGIHTGTAVVGFIGSDNRLDYTAIGDNVNLASRIEGSTKGVARILVSDSTRAACGEAFRFIDRGSFKVKGRQQEVRLYEPQENAT